jgi:hypothetical protein
MGRSELQFYDYDGSAPSACPRYQIAPFAKVFPRQFPADRQRGQFCISLPSRHEHLPVGRLADGGVESTNAFLPKGITLADSPTPLFHHLRK